MTNVQELSPDDINRNPSQAGATISRLVEDPDVIAEPYGNVVDLPGGWVDNQGALHRTAEVRELTGADEEVVQKAMTKGNQFDYLRMLAAIMDRGLVKVGDVPASSKLVNSLYYGDRDTILLAIRIATYGHEYETNITCPKCGESSDVAFDLYEDIPQRKLDNPEQIYRTVNLRRGRKAEVRLVTVADQTAASKDMTLSGAERNTILLAACVKSIDDQPTLGIQTMKDLGAGDRKILAEYLMDNAPGPRMGEVVVPCPKCNLESEITLGMPALFLGG